MNLILPNICSWIVPYTIKRSSSWFPSAIIVQVVLNTDDNPLEHETEALRHPIIYNTLFKNVLNFMCYIIVFNANVYGHSELSLGMEVDPGPR